MILIKREFWRRDNKSAKVVSKVVELKQLEQDPQIMNKFVQIFRRAVRKSEYERRVLVKEFKRRMNDNIRRNSIEFFCVISMQVSFS